MSTQPEQAKAEILQQIVAAINEKVPEDRREQVEEFARQYYQRLAPEDLLELDPDDLYGAALAHWRLAERRQPGEAKVRVYSPRIEQHGWRSPHTIVEIVTDDMPFLVDSVAMELNRHGLVIHLTIHPVIAVRRDDAGGLVEVLPPDADRRHPRVVHALRGRPPERARGAGPAAGRARAGPGDVRAAVEDWRPMREQVALDPGRAGRAAAAGRRGRAGRGQGVAASGSPTTTSPSSATAPTTWSQQDGEDMLRPVPGTGLGILRQGQTEHGLAQLRQAAAGGPAAGPRAATSLVLTKANARSTVHRPLPRLRRRQALRRARQGGRRAPLPRPVHLGRLQPRTRATSRCCAARSRGDRAGRPAPASHDGKALLNILETYPRDELFQIADDELFETAMGILRLQERQRVRLFVRRDASAASSPAWSTCRATATTPTVRLRIRTSCTRRFPGAERRVPGPAVGVGPGPPALHRPPAPGEHARATTPSELEASWPTATRSWTDELRDALL